jgi:hypothetical protein
MLEPQRIAHTLTQLGAGLVEQFFAVFHRRSFFLTRDEFGPILSQSTFFIGSACRLTQEDAHDLMSHEIFDP